jgi:hypothetical protein
MDGQKYLAWLLVKHLHLNHLGQLLLPHQTFLKEFFNRSLASITLYIHNHECTLLKVGTSISVASKPGVGYNELTLAVVWLGKPQRGSSVLAPFLYISFPPLYLCTFT